MKIYNENEIDVFGEEGIKPKLGMMYYSKGWNNDKQLYCIDEIRMDGYVARPVIGNKYITKLMVLIENKVSVFLIIFILAFLIGVFCGVGML